MKRYLIVVLSLFLSTIALSQSFYSMPLDNDFKKISGAIPWKVDYVFNYGFALDSMIGGISTANVAYLWPDTTVILPDGSSNNIMAVSVNVNPCSVFFNLPIFKAKSSTTYYLEEIGIYGFYKREPQFQYAVDTLIVQVKLSPNENSYWQHNTESWVMNNYGTDTLFYRSNKIDKAWPYSNDSNVLTFKYLLDSNSVYDTLSNGVNYFKVPTHIETYQFYCGHYFEESHVTVIFKPGFSWNANVDTITHLNRFRFISFEENSDAGGSGTYPVYVEKDYNTSYILHKDALYNKNNPSLFATNNLPDSSLTPSYAFKAAYPFEHHWIDVICKIVYKIGVESIDLKDQIHSFPNPASDYLSIVNQNTADVVESIEIYDITGNCVLKPNPDQAQKISIAELSQGVYFMKIVTESSKQHILKFIKN